MKEALWIAMLAGLVGILAATPVGAAADDSDARVAAILQTVKPFDTLTRDAAVEQLIRGGDALVPAIRRALATAEETRREALDAALVRLTWKDDPAAKAAAWLTKQAGGSRSQIPAPVHIYSSELESLFPDRLFYSVIFRAYPVARLAPAPLAMQNVLVYEKDATVRLFTTPKDAQAYFMRSIGTLRTQGEMRKLAAAWLYITQEFSQDGFFRFTVPEDQIKSAWQESGGLVITGKALVVPKGGDSGEIVAVLTFAGQGNGPRRLVSIAEKRDVKAGVRPICQATKLLDPDPIVRRMAEQDLRVMGRAAWPYIMEQRAKARPELRKAIDRMWERILAEGP